MPSAPKTVRRHSTGPDAPYRTPALLDFVSDLLGREDDGLRKIREETPSRGLPPISIGPEEGKILDLFTRAAAARRVAEVGTLAGYSACWMARALADGGKLHSVEFSPLHAQVARENIARLGLSGRVQVHVGPALEVLPTLEREGPFDLCFIDADKANYPGYLRWAVKNVRPGGFVIGDNAYFFGKIHLDPKKAGEDAAGVSAMREFLKILADRSLFSSCAMLPTNEGMAVGVRK